MAKEPDITSSYGQGVLNSLMPQHIQAQGEAITERDMAGEAIEMLRLISGTLYPELEEDEIGVIDYSDLSKILGVESAEGLPQGQMQVSKRNGRYLITDDYPFQANGGQNLVEDFEGDDLRTGDTYKMRDWARGVLNTSDNKNYMQVTIPDEPSVVDIDYDDPFHGVYYGEMTNARQKQFKQYASGIIDNFFSTIKAPIEYFDDDNLMRRGNTYTPIGDTNYRRDKRRKDSGSLKKRFDTLLNQIGGFG